MPQGYLVQLSDNSLDSTDSIAGPLTGFLIQQDLGAGDWVWSGTWNGQTFNDVSEPGQFYHATDGNVYFVPDFGAVDTITAAKVESAPAGGFTSNDGVVGGTTGSDRIDPSQPDTDGDRAGATDDTISSGEGDDTVKGAAGADTIIAGGGQDTVTGGDGADVIHGGSNGAAPVVETLNWSALDTDGTDLSGGFTLNTGEMDVTVGFTDDGDNSPTFRVETTDPMYTATGESFATDSSLDLFAQGAGASSTTTIDFAATSGSVMDDEVQNVAFRINDLDWGDGNHRDIVTIDAYDADGAPVAVTLDTGGGQTVSGNTVSSDNTATATDDLAGSVLVEMDGPVQRIEIAYENGLGNTQAINVTDIRFETVLPEDGADSLDGGTGADRILGAAGADTLDGGVGADTLVGGTGDDVMRIAEGDTADGGAGDDLFVLEDLGEDGTGTISLTGGETGETGGDTLQLTPEVTFADLTFTNTDDMAGGLSGNFAMADGTAVTFSEIENIICFTAGARILTPRGERPVETLCKGDLVITRDHGARPVRWIGRRTVAGHARFAPILVQPGVLDGATRPLRVSPQHRFLFAGYKAQLLFGDPEVLVAATHLVDGNAVIKAPCDQVTYFHLMFDRHEIIYAENAATESFQAAEMGLSAVCDAAREEIFSIFPELRTGAGAEAARPCLKQHEARLLATAEARCMNAA